MENVGNFLRQEAMSRTDVIERDSFGRTAFNRYYYAVFLAVRNGLSTMNSDWNEPAHSTLPALLKGSVNKGLKKGLSEAQRNSDKELITLCNRALSATNDLADLLDQGRITRVAADYHPEIAVDFTSTTGFRLNTIEVKDAQAWPHKARAYIGTIVLAWMQINA